MISKFKFLCVVVFVGLLVACATEKPVGTGSNANDPVISSAPVRIPVGLGLFSAK